MIQLNSVEEFEKAIEQDQHIFMLKHSATCPISGSAYHEYESFIEENDDITAYYLIVQESRPLSNYIAEKYDIRHESPQAFLFAQNKAVWNASHWDITKETLTEVLEDRK